MDNDPSPFLCPRVKTRLAPYLRALPDIFNYQIATKILLALIAPIVGVGVSISLTEGLSTKSRPSCRIRVIVGTKFVSPQEGVTAKIVNDSSCGTPSCFYAFYYNK